MSLLVLAFAQSVWARVQAVPADETVSECQQKTEDVTLKVKESAKELSVHKSDQKPLRTPSQSLLDRLAEATACTIHYIQRESSYIECDSVPNVASGNGRSQDIAEHAGLLIEQGFLPAGCAGLRASLICLFYKAPARTTPGF